MNTFDYEQFNAQYETLKKLIGGEETDPSTISGVVVNSNTSISNGLEYAENSSWAGSKLTEWSELLPSLKTQLANLNVMLQQAKQACDAYHQFEIDHQGVKGQ